MNHLAVSIIMGGVVLVMTNEANKSVLQEWRATKHQSIRLDRELATNAIRQRMQCQNSMTSGTCTAGSTIRLVDGNNNLLVAEDGSSAINGWNFKVECNTSCSASNQYCLMTRRMSGNQVSSDPLTGKSLDWHLAKEMNGSDLTQLSDYCASDPSNLTMVLGSSCYGDESGKNTNHPLVPSYATEPYCISSQRTPPDCPAGKIKMFSRVDRYGAEGRDFNWMTICK